MFLKMYFKNFDFKELFFPVLNDFKSLNNEIDEKFISNNNWELANSESNHTYEEVIQKIAEAKEDVRNERDSENIIFVKR
ncbi:hypothetical protein [Bizionia paragorgiae]|uniref:hypothetical protein n=1 Tax=Bizionia paragorgiae TaxID=283786 RepID=UPI003A9037B9